MPATDQRMTMKAFVVRHHIRIASEWADLNKNAPDWKDANHFKVTLRRGRHQLTTYFSQGYGISGEPTADAVLECLASDAASIDNARSFEEWAGELGYDTDSRKAEQSYKVTQRQSEKLQRFLGMELYQQALYEVEH